MSIFVSQDGRLWHEAGRVPHTCKDGRVVDLILWHTPCRKCDAMVEIRASVNCDLSRNNFFQIVHCEAHRIRPRKYRDQAPFPVPV